MPRVSTTAHHRPPLFAPRLFPGSGWLAFLCNLHWRRSRGYLKNATCVATVAGDLYLAPRIFTVLGALIATFWRKAFAGRVRAFLRVCHGRQTGNSRSNVRILAGAAARVHMKVESLARCGAGWQPNAT